MNPEKQNQQNIENNSSKNTFNERDKNQSRDV
jgi:hypothetical protein